MVALKEKSSKWTIKLTTIHPEEDMNVCVPNLTLIKKFQPHGGTRCKIRASFTLLGFINWGTMNVCTKLNGSPSNIG